ncbi:MULTISPECIES: SMI1/KNR4 family protein [unclassified Streptomyces]|uniref:SMI1/KNR4 family protein n=1 Tax=unclassified Streptomyces TaxID=2593676 RepID=UPI003663BDA7
MDIDQVVPAESAELRAAFDVDDHGASALGWEAVHAFEAEHGVVLPEPYRTFVAEITDGSYAGPPAYGLLPLAELPADWGEDPGKRDPGKPFPLTTAWMWEEDTDPAEDMEETLERVHHHGSIVLGTDGCAMNWHLVVAGPQRGHVWLITDVGAAPFGEGFGFGSTTTEPGFAGWVRHWAAGRPWFDDE